MVRLVGRSLTLHGGLIDAALPPSRNAAPYARRNTAPRDAIASRARASNEAAERAVGATAQATSTVAETVRGVARSRDLIRETDRMNAAATGAA